MRMLASRPHKTLHASIQCRFLISLLIGQGRHPNDSTRNGARCVAAMDSAVLVTSSHASAGNNSRRTSDHLVEALSDIIFTSKDGKGMISVSIALFWTFWSHFKFVPWKACEVVSPSS